MSALGVYIHIPFCLRKCHYCDFVSYPDMQDTFDEYIDALLTEAQLYKDVLSTREIDTVFIGGGTPSLLSAIQIERLVNGLKQRSNFQPTEFTIETNPESIIKDKLSAYQNVGVNRLSIGLQSHDDDILRSIGRGHTCRDFLSAYDKASKLFDNINVDTIFALPAQSIDNFRETLELLIALAPAHISAYALKLEPGTKLYNSFRGIDDEIDRKMYHAVIRMLSDAGYIQYETSNFSRGGKECIHNLKYWTGQEYLGLGVAAHSFLESNTRFSNTNDIEQYLHMIKSGQKAVDNTTTLSDDDLLDEYIMLRLRLSSGISFKDINNKFHINFERDYAKAIEDSKTERLIQHTDNAICPTIKGFDLQNTLISKFMK